MIVLTGKSGSGKDTIKKELVKNYGYKNIVTYTSRPKRRGEKDGVDYHFISEEEFKEKIEEGFFAEYKEYPVQNGDVWYYGCSIKDIKDNINNKSIIILTPQGVQDIIDNIGIKLKVFYLYSNRNTILKRLTNRGDEEEEIVRRMDKDNKDFAKWEMKVFKTIYNHDGYDIKNVAKKIIDYCEE